MEPSSTTSTLQGIIHAQTSQKQTQAIGYFDFHSARSEAGEEEGAEERWGHSFDVDIDIEDGLQDDLHTRVRASKITIAISVRGQALASPAPLNSGTAAPPVSTRGANGKRWALGSMLNAGEVFGCSPVASHRQGHTERSCGVATLFLWLRARVRSVPASSRAVAGTACIRRVAETSCGSFPSPDYVSRSPAALSFRPPDSPPRMQGSAVLL
ncbi:hypothetical protein C8R45DRAFT_1081855 [Mycena sanguinolenta]|nr:hypothetical protein C8R45DRAFT_1081855 [Mycena sanguinolenta]